MEAKIAAIILTDFLCWVPLTAVCFLHFIEVIDATPWYPIFSSILLPLNSVINPVLYNRKIERAIFTHLLRMVEPAPQMVTSMRTVLSEVDEGGNTDTVRLRKGVAAKETSTEVTAL